MPNKTVGVVLSGCGYLDGSEIHEAVLALLYLDRAGVAVRCFAPDDSVEVVDHASGESGRAAPRNMLHEAARIARGRIEPLAAASAVELDALVMPGGFGAAKHLSTFAAEGPRATVLPELQALVRDLHAAGKPIGAICIAPAILAVALRGTGVQPTLTVGDDGEAAAALSAMGARHQVCPVTGVVVDEVHRLVTTPAYMFDASIADVSTGVEKLVQAVLRLMVR
jgi:enhancing lycopene biosynthesis protein 2